MGGHRPCRAFLISKKALGGWTVSIASCTSPAWEVGEQAENLELLASSKGGFGGPVALSSHCRAPASHPWWELDHACCKLRPRAAK